MSWPIVALKAVTSLITKGTTPTTLGKAYASSGIPFLRAENLQNGTVALSGSLLFIDQETDALLSRSVIEPNDVLISIAGTIGRVGLVPANAPRMNCNQAVAIVRPTTPLQPRFLMYWLMGWDAATQMAGSKVTQTISNLSLGQIGALQLPVPAAREQSRIVELLDEADRLRRIRREADAKAARILPSLFLKMFGDPATNPMRWPVEPLTKICSPKQWPTISAKELTEFGFPVYGANGTIGFYSSYNHEQPTVLITCRGATCGTINVCAPMSYVTGNAMALDEPDLGKTSLEFLECYLNVRGLDDTITGAAQPQITRQNLQTVTVFVPPPGLLADFSRHVRAIKALLSGVQSGGDRLEDAFGLLLQRAFSGQLTAQWREARMQELLAEMKQQALALHLPVPTELEALS